MKNLFSWGVLLGLVVSLGSLGGCQSRLDAQRAEQERMRPMAAHDPAVRINGSEVFVWNTSKTPPEIYEALRLQCQDTFNWDVVNAGSDYDPWYCRLQFETAVGAHVVFEAERIRLSKDDPFVSSLSMQSGLLDDQEEDMLRRLRELTDVFPPVPSF